MNQKLAFKILMALMALLPVAHADDAAQATPTSDEATQALADLKSRFRNADGSVSLEHSAELVAAVAGTSAVTYQVGRAIYQANVAQTAKASRLLEVQIKTARLAIEKAIAPELERYGSAVLKANASRVAAGGERLAANEARDAIMKGLASPESKARILERLKGALGSEAKSAFEKITGPRSEALIAEEVQGFYKVGELQKIMRVGEEGFGAFMATRLGQNIAQRISASVAPVVGRALFKSVVADLAAESIGARCLGALGFLGKGALRVVGSSTVLVASILLTPSDLGDGTQSGYFKANPQALLDLPNEQAVSWLEQYPGIRESVVSTRDIVAEMALADGSPLEHGSAGEILNCEPPPALDPGVQTCEGTTMPSS